jgi:hypothetical protein
LKGSEGPASSGANKMIGLILRKADREDSES